MLCGGYNKWGMLVDGGRNGRLVADASHGSQRYLQDDAGSGHTCAIARDAAGVMLERDWQASQLAASRGYVGGGQAHVLGMR